MNKKILLIPSLVLATLLAGCGQNSPSTNVSVVESSSYVSSNISSVENIYSIQDSSTITYMPSQQANSENSIQSSNIENSTASSANSTGSTSSTKTITSSVIAYDGEHGRTNGRLSDSLAVTLTLDSNNIIQAVSLDQSAGQRESQNWQSRFSSAIESSVIGKSLNSISVSRIGGASNTSLAFNQALESIKSQA